MPIRVTVLRNGSRSGGQVVLVSSSLDELLETVGQRLNITAKRIFLSSGNEVQDIEALREDDQLIATEGEDAVPLSPAASGGGRFSDVRPCVDRPSVAWRDNWLSLNVGGQIFMTTRATLTKDTDSMLARMFTTDEETGQRSWYSATDSTGAYLIDRSPEYFRPLLNYLRSNDFILDDSVNIRGVLEEARFFGLTKAVEHLEEVIQEKEDVDAPNAPLTRKEFVKLLIPTTVRSELRCQGINLARADLRRLDLRGINFREACLERCNLSHANMGNCIMNRADLQNATLDGANLQGVNMVRANCERASMRGCNFDDPAGKSANMEGANMKHAILEDSQMSRVDLRVACLRRASLRRCDLQGANLAGTDLENCDLSGSDLRHANLRGSNLRGTILEDMQSPLHMSQTVS